MLKIDFTSFFYGFNYKCPSDIVFTLMALFFPRCEMYIFLLILLFLESFIFLLFFFLIISIIIGHMIFIK